MEDSTLKKEAIKMEDNNASKNKTAKTSEKFSKMQTLTLTGMFAAIILLLNFTPFLGFIILPMGRATTLHIPVIIGSILLGPKVGAGLGFLFGFCSFLTASTAPMLSSFVFSPLIPVPGTDSGSPWALVVAFVPRILLGIVPWYLYKLLGRITPERFQMVHLPVTAIVSAAFHTFLVMFLWYSLFRDPWAYARGETVGEMFAVVMFIISTNGLAEAIVAAILVPAVSVPLFVVARRYVVRQSTGV